MICPHCKKAIKIGVTKESIKKAKHYLKQGFSMRETEKLLFADGIIMSFSSISRMMKDSAKVGE